MNLIRIGVATALLSLGLPALAHGDSNHAGRKPAFDASKVEQRSFGREGDPKKVSRTIRVDMNDAFRFTPSDVVIKRGETVKFVVTNSGRQLHEMVLGTPDELKAHSQLMKKFPDMEHADANMAHVKPGRKGEIVWQFNQPGEYQFACLVAGHFEAGMIGSVLVK